MHRLQCIVHLPVLTVHQLIDGVLDECAPVSNRTLAGDLRLCTGQDVQQLGERSDGTHLAGLDAHHGDRTTEFDLGDRCVREYSTEETAPHCLQPRVRGAVGAEIHSPRRPAVGFVDTPAHTREVHVALPRLDVAATHAETVEHERRRDHVEHIRHAEATAQQRDEIDHETSALVELAKSAVGNHQGEDERLAVLRGDGTTERGLQQRSCALDVRGHDDDLVRLQVGQLTEGVEQRVVQHLDLACEVVRPVHEERLVVCGNLVRGDRRGLLHGPLQMTEQTCVTDGCRARLELPAERGSGEQTLEIHGAAQP